MRLYVNAESKNQIGYTPDWIQVSFKDKKDITHEYTFDIHGGIDYNPLGLNCRAIGTLVPFQEYVNGVEVFTNGELKDTFPESKIIEIFEKGTEFVVGIDDVLFEDCSEETAQKLRDDVVSNCSCELHIFDGTEEHTFEFKADIERNID